MKSAGSRQLALAFADSPTGGRGRGTQDESRGKRYLLHTAKVNNRKDPATSTTAANSERAMESVASAHNLAQALLNVSRNKGAPGVDDQTVEEVVEQAPSLLPKLQTVLLQGTYEPGDIRRVWIEKPGGGQRGLGIPNVMDRWIQQAVLQILEPIFEPTFHASSHGFRRNRGAHTAIAEAKEHLKAGYRVLVDLDLSKFFDRVHHQRLLERLRQRVHDSRVLDLVKRMLTAKVVMPDGTKVTTMQGTPQGGPLSPLLANIMLDPLDKELERRGLRFARYADDFLVLVKSLRAAQRVMQSVTRFVEVRLQLVVNRQKSQAAALSKCAFLGFQILRGRIAWTEKAQKRFKKRLQEITSRSRGVSTFCMLRELRRYVVGWLNYFGISQAYRVVPELDQWLRRRVRMYYWKQWKRARTRRRQLIRLGIHRAEVFKATRSHRAYWFMAGTSIVQRALNNEWLAERGVPNLKQQWVEMHYGKPNPQCNPAAVNLTGTA